MDQVTTAAAISGLIKTWLITGIPGSGKTTTAAALASRFTRGAHISGDQLENLIVSGNAPPNPFGDAESDRQIELCVRNQCLLATSFRAEGFAVVIDYVIASEDRLATYLELLPDEPVGLAVLAPSIAVARARDRERPDKHVLAAWAHLQDHLGQELGDRGLWLDTSNMTVAATANAILARQHEALRGTDADSSAAVDRAGSE
jgi:predicted kinase